MKKCTHCNKSKPLPKFRRTKKSIDGYHYVCKECLMSWKEFTKKRASTIAKQLWFDIMDLAFDEVIGVKMFFNKKMFLEWVESNPNFNTLYEEWLTYEYNTKILTLELIKPTPEGSYTLDNINFFIRDLEPTEDLDKARNTQANRT